MIRQFVLLLLLNFQLPAQHAIDCGAEGMRSCDWKDWETYNMRYWNKASCDHDLKEVNGQCVNDKRRQLGFPYTWTNWAIKQQIQSIGNREAINFITWPGAHNAFSNQAQGFTDFFYRNQNYSITDLLNYGIRHLELDPHFYGAAGRFEVRLCHASSTYWCTNVGWETRLFSDVLIEINAWLAANPSEILIIKLDDKLTDFNAGSDGFTPLQNLISTHIGSRVYKYSLTNYNPQNWPTPADFKAQGKQVLFTINNSGPHKSQWMWDAKGHFLSDNHPSTQDFTTCTDSAGKTPATRPILDWWDTAEGRSGSNVTLNSFSSNTGLYVPAANSLLDSTRDRRIADAAKCGVSIIGMDFVQALDTAFYSSTGADTRLTEAVWSWKQNDYGLAGPAMLEASSGRWVSRPQSEVHPYVCAMKRNAVTDSQARNWRVTTQSGPWNKLAGDFICQQSFSTSYEFAVPTNGFQQGELLKAVNSDAWLSYSVVPVSSLTVTPGEFPFTMLRGSAPPAPTSFTINGVNAMSVTVDSSPALPPWLSVALPSNPTVLNGPTASAQIRITDAATTMAPGHYFATVNLRGVYTGYPDSIATLTVHLNVRVNSSITFSGPASVPWNSTYSMTARVTVPGVTNPEGQVNLLKGTPIEGGGYSTTIVQTGYLLTGNTQGGVLTFNVSSQVTPGEHVYSAFYGAVNSANDSESNPVFVTVQPRVATPSSVLFTMPAGGTPPQYQTVMLNGLTSPNSVIKSSGCQWIIVDLGQGGAKLYVDGARTPLAPGEYLCNLQFKDMQTEIGGYFEVPVTLRLTTALSVNPTVLNLTAAAGAPPSIGAFSVSAGNAKIPVTFSTNQPWLTVSRVQEDPNTPIPGAAAIADASGLPVGTRSADITVSSPLAATPVLVRVNLNVIPATVVSTNPVGLPVTVDGVTYTKTVAFAWAAGTQHTVAVANTIDGGNGTRLRYANWSNGAPSPSFQYTATSAGGNLIASFLNEFLLSTSAVPTGAGSININPASADGYYAANTPVSLTAVPASGNEFLGWTGALNGSLPSGNVVMSAPRSVAAAFRQITGVDLNITSATPGVAVTVNGVSYGLPAKIVVSPGSTVALAAQDPSPGATVRSLFASWSDGGAQGHSITMPSAAYSLLLNYKTQYSVTLQTSPVTGGTVSGAGWYDAGSSATVQATANTGYVFSGFSGGLTGTQNPRTVQVNAPLSVTANFGPSGQPSLALTTSGNRDSATFGFRTVLLNLVNRGLSSALDARIVSITNIAVASGFGEVTAVSPMPILFGAISPGATVSQAVDFNWPLTATRVRFTVNFVANSGAYAGSTTLTLFR